MVAFIVAPCQRRAIDAELIDVETIGDWIDEHIGIEAERGGEFLVKDLRCDFFPTDAFVAGAKSVHVVHRGRCQGLPCFALPR
jgi:hypothetical protein